MITKAILPPRKGYVERVNPNTGEHYYHKVYTKVGTTHKKLVIDNSQAFTRPFRSINLMVTLVGAGASVASGINGANGEIVSKRIPLEFHKKYAIAIGEAGSNGESGEPTSFGDLLIAMGGQSGVESDSKPLIVDGLEYGRGETPDAPATNGICIIEYDEVIYE